jgi:glutathione S-transferase
MNTNLTLHADNLWISPYGFSSFVALREKNLTFDLAEVSLIDFEHLGDKYRSNSLTARVPTLVESGFAVSESSAIAEYLEEAYSPPKYPALLPHNLRERARARQLMAWLRSDLDALRSERSTITMFYRLQVPELTEGARKAAEKLYRVADQVIPAGEGPLFGNWSLVDSELAFMLHRLILNGDSVPERVLAYAQAQWQRPSAIEFTQHARPASVPEGYWKYAGTAPLLPA